jgi:hypothetical protein
LPEPTSLPETPIPENEDDETDANSQIPFCGGTALLIFPLAGFYFSRRKVE